MYVHLGEDTVVKTSDIVTIIDLDNTTTSKITKSFLATAQKQNKVINVTRELPKSAVICNSNGESKVYISQISPATLQKRIILNQFSI